MKIIGITGTCGKSTTAMITGALLRAAGKKTAVIGTMGIYREDGYFATVNTTPCREILQEQLELLEREAYEFLVLEVSSHGVQQERIAGIRFDLGVFTNFSRDHIGAGEHGSMEEYLECKKEFFRRCSISLVNADDPYSREIAGASAGSVVTYGRRGTAYCLREVKCRKEGRQMYTVFKTWGKLEGVWKIPMIGEFNAYNALCALAVLAEMNIPANEQIKDTLAATCVEGRTQIIPLPNGAHVIIDYAHNEKELELLMDTVKNCGRYQRIISVFGAGGNRSKDRRAMYGRVMEGRADLLILTADNPRDEPLTSINQDILSGFRQKLPYLEIDDRREAVLKAMELAGEGDVILLIGKGHERYIEIKGTRFPFSEQEIVLERIRQG